MLKNYLMVFFVSMVPVIELRGAIPIGLGMGLPALPTYLVCVLGNMLPVPFIYLFARRFLIWGYHKPVIGPVCKFFITKGEKGLDRHAGGLHSGHEVQGCSHCLHGRCAAGGHHHGPGQRRCVGRGQQPVCSVTDSGFAATAPLIGKPSPASPIRRGGIER